MKSDDALEPHRQDLAEAEDRLNWFEQFLPKSRSKIIFLAAVSCYTFTITTLEIRLIKIFGLWPKIVDPVRHVLRDVRLGEGHNQGHSQVWTVLLLSPVLESLLVVGFIELLRRTKFSIAVQIVGPTLLICGLHSAIHTVWGFVVAPIFFIGAASYVYWRRMSFWTGTLAIIWVHFFWNASAFLLSLSS
jgi:hypothetical protein